MGHTRLGRMGLVPFPLRRLFMRQFMRLVTWRVMWRVMRLVMWLVMRLVVWRVMRLVVCSAERLPPRIVLVPSVEPLVRHVVGTNLMPIPVLFCVLIVLLDRHVMEHAGACHLGLYELEQAPE